MSHRPGLTCACATITLLGILFNLAVLIIMPLVRPDLDYFEHPPSYYAVGPWAMLQAAAFAAMGIASITLAIALHQSATATAGMHLCTIALGIAGIASLGLVWFPMDRPGWHTPIGDMHQTAGTVGGVAQLVAALGFTVATRADARWSGLFRPAASVFVIALIGAILSQISLWRSDLGLPMGITMRLVVAPLLLLWGLVAWRLRDACRPGPTRSSAGR